MFRSVSGLSVEGAPSADRLGLRHDGTHAIRPRVAAKPDAHSAPEGGRVSGRLLLVRHGQTEWSRTGRHTGRTDVPLTDEGEGQARALRGWAQGLRPRLVVTSPLQRARRTAELAGL